MDYTKHDYTALVNEVTTKLGAAEGWGEAYQSSSGQLLIQLFADTTDSLMYMLEKRTQESFISTARLQSSIFSHASELGYRPRRVVSSTGNLVINLKDAAGNTLVAQDNIIIPKFTKVTLNNPVVEYVTTEEVIIQTGFSSAIIPVKEGNHVQLQYDATQAPISDLGEIVIDDYRYIDEYSLSVYDDSESYYDVEGNDAPSFSYGSLIYAGVSDPVYDVRYALEGMRIVFGDNIFGKRPSGTVTVNYVRSNRVSRSILTTGLEFSFENETLTDESGTIPITQYYYTLTNSTPIRGYLGSESTLDIARNAPEAARANQRCLTRADYEYWGRRSGIGGIVDVNAYGEQESGSLIYNMNNVNMTYITDDLQPITVPQLEELRDYMNRYTTITTHLVVQEANKLETALTIKHKKPAGVPISNEDLYSFIKLKVEEFYNLGRGSIGNDLDHSELVTYIQTLTKDINGTVYNMTDYVRIDVQPQYKLPDTYATYDVRVLLDDSYVINDGDTWTVNINGDDISVVVDSGDDLDTLAEKMRSAISSNTPLLTMIEDPANGKRIIRLQSGSIYDTFTINIPASDLSSLTSTTKIFKIPGSVIYNLSEDNLVTPGTCSIVDENENVLFLDDGSGTLVAQQPGNDIGIDYTSVELLDPYNVGSGVDYFFRFQQNEFQNVQVNENSVVTLSPFAEFGDPNLMSSIELV